MKCVNQCLFLLLLTTLDTLRKKLWIFQNYHHGINHVLRYFGHIHSIEMKFGRDRKVYCGQIYNGTTIEILE